MLVGRLDELEEKGRALPPAILKAMKFLQENDLNGLAEGRYEIDGDRCYATVSRYMTKAAAECYPEAHRRYVDIQYIVEGEEYIDVCPLNPELVVREPYDAARDIEFFENLVPESSVPLQAGDFAVLLPRDVHRPGVAMAAPRPVVKVVIKLEAALMEAVE